MKAQKPRFDLDAKTHKLPELERKPYFPHHTSKKSQAKNGISKNEYEWGSGYVSPSEMVVESYGWDYNGTEKNEYEWGSGYVSPAEMVAESYGWDYNQIDKNGSEWGEGY